MKWSPTNDIRQWLLLIKKNNMPIILLQKPQRDDYRKCGWGWKHWNRRNVLGWIEHVLGHSKVFDGAINLVVCAVWKVLVVLSLNIGVGISSIEYWSSIGLVSIGKVLVEYSKSV